MAYELLKNNKTQKTVFFVLKTKPKTKQKQKKNV